MTPSKSGLSTGGKAGAVVVLIIIVLGAIYLIPRFSAPSQTQGPSTNPGAQQITGMPSLFYDFSKMQVSVDVNDPLNGNLQNQSYSYTVLGKGTLTTTATTTGANGQVATSTTSAVYTRVEYATVGVGDNVVVWYNSTGGIGEVDVVGVRNYTGSGAGNLPFITNYASTFGGLVALTNNATLLSRLGKTSTVLTSIGPTQMEVTTYVLSGRSPPYSSLTMGVATIPGTSVQLVTYLNEKTTDGVTSVIQVTSLTR